MDYLEEREKQARRDFEQEMAAATVKFNKIMSAIVTLRGDDPTAIIDAPAIVETTTKSELTRTPKISSGSSEINGVQVVKDTAVLMVGEYDNKDFIVKAQKTNPKVTSNDYKLIRDTLSKVAKAGQAWKVDSNEVWIVTVKPRSGRIPATYRTIIKSTQPVSAPIEENGEKIMSDTSSNKVDLDIF